MAHIRYTKTELRQQQVKLAQLEKYLPTLQLKKAMLQLEINQVLGELDQLGVALSNDEQKIRDWCQLFTDRDAENVFLSTHIIKVKKHCENIAGVEIPVFDSIVFEEANYHLLDTPYWLDRAISDLRDLIETRKKMEVLSEKKRLLEKELREVSIRVNLFEKIMIPRTKKSIKKIKIFLGDQQLAAVSQAKASKRKILERKGAV
jgi:V/A-type H+-transporting ATPase subunit D